MRIYKNPLDKLGFYPIIRQTDRQTDGQTRAEKKGSGKHVIWIALLVLFAAPVGAPLLVALAAVLYDFTPKPTGTVEFE